jgi:uncharacterized protein
MVRTESMDTTSFPSSHNASSERACQVLDALKHDDDNYKRKALDKALTLRSELTEPLLEILKDAAADPIEFIDSGNDALAYAALLLSFWEEKRAFPYFIQFAQYGDDILDDLWGDMVTQDFQSFLYRTGKKDPGALKALAQDSKAYIYIRVAALGALNWSIIDEIVSREEMLRFHAELFSDSKNRRNSHLMGSILAEWLDIYPVDYQALIQNAFNYREIDETIAGKWNDVKRELATESWERSFLKLKEEMNRWMHKDIHDYTAWWSGRDERNSEEHNRPTPENPFKDLEADFLKKPLAIFMRDHGVSMRYHEMRAYLLGAILGLELVPPSHLIAEILLQDTEDEAEFKNEKDAQAFFTLFMQLWNELASWPKEGTPLFDSVPKNLDDPEMTSALSGLTLFRRRAEVQHLLIGLYESDTDSDAIQDPKAKTAFDWLESYSELLEKLCFKVAKNGTNFDEPTRLEVTALLNEGDLKWPQAYRALEEGLKKQRLAAIEAKRILAEMQGSHSPTVERDEPKVGRNDPCPCGSGKKFKKCCLH